MKFFQYLTAALLPMTVFAIPAAEPELKAVSAPATITTEDFHLLMKRQTDLGSIIGDLTDSLGSIKELLSSDSLKNINTVVTQLAAVCFITVYPLAQSI